MAGPALVQEPVGGGQNGLPLLAEAVHRHVRHRGGHGHHHGVRVRHQLGDVLPVRGRHLRGAARGRGAVRLLPRIDVPRRAAVRAQPGEPQGLLRVHVAGGLRRPAFGTVDHHRQQLAADSGRYRRRGRQRRAHRLLGRGVQPVHAAALLPHRLLHLGGRRAPGRRRRRLLPAHAAPHRVRQEDSGRRGRLRAHLLHRHADHRRLAGAGWWPSTSRSRWPPTKASSTTTPNADLAALRHHRRRTSRPSTPSSPCRACSAGPPPDRSTASRRVSTRCPPDERPPLQADVLHLPRHGHPRRLLRRAAPRGSLPALAQEAVHRPPLSGRAHVVGSPRR